MYTPDAARIAIARLHKAALNIVASERSFVDVASYHILQTNAILRLV